MTPTEGDIARSPKGRLWRVTDVREAAKGGGERVCVECDEPVDSQGTTTGDCPGGSGDKCDECFACSCDGSC